MGNVATQTAEEINQMVFNKRLSMNDATKLLSRIFKILKILKIFESSKKCYFQNFQIQISSFQKTGIYVKEPYQVYLCKKNQVDILKNDQLMAFWRSIMTIFHAASCDLHIFMIFKFCPILAV